MTLSPFPLYHQGLELSFYFEIPAIHTRACVPSTSLVISAPALEEWKGRVCKPTESFRLNKVL